MLLQNVLARSSMLIVVDGESRDGYELTAEAAKTKKKSICFGDASCMYAFCRPHWALVLLPTFTPVVHDLKFTCIKYE